MFRFFKRSHPRARLTSDEVTSILHAYGDLLCDQGAPYVQDESRLPVAKSQVKEALAIAIATDTDNNQRSQYKAAYLLLANFQPLVGREGVPFLGDAPDPAVLERFLLWSERVESESQILAAELEQLEAKIKGMGQP